jgi:dTDP-L-rhamnose 4-epimerase
MRILVIGGAGFIGSHTVDALIHQGHNVRILDSLEKPVHLNGKPDYMNKKADFILGDLRNKKILEKALKDIEIIYHFAAYQDYAIDFSKYFSVNSAGTALIYEIMVENKLPIRKIILASSQAVMGEGCYICPNCSEIDKKLRKTDFGYELLEKRYLVSGLVYPDIRLEDQLKKGEWDFKCSNCGEKLEVVSSDESVSNPQNQYGLSKYSQELIALNLGKRYSIPTVCLRYSIVQGARQSFYNTYSGVMRIFCLNLFFDKSPTIYEDGNQIRDYINIKDVVEANLLVLDKDEINHDIYNVGGGKAYTVKQFYDKVLKIFNKNIQPKIPGEYRYGDTRHIYSDISKLKKLGWEPMIPIEQSINEYKQYLKEQVDIEDILEFQNKKMRDLNIVRKVIS